MTTTEFWLTVLACVTVALILLVALLILEIRDAAHRQPMTGGHWDPDLDDLDHELQQLLATERRP